MVQSLKAFRSFSAAWLAREGFEKKLQGLDADLINITQLLRVAEDFLCQPTPPIAGNKLGLLGSRQRMTVCDLATAQRMHVDRIVGKHFTSCLKMLVLSLEIFLNKASSVSSSL